MRTIIEKENMDIEKQLAVMKSRCAELISEGELVGKIKKHRHVRIKLGIDASAPEIHLGIAVQLRKLRQFQDLGHTAVLVVGDFTGMIGDPSGLSKTRPKLTRETIKKNMAKYREQIFKILDPKRTEFVYNSKWLGALTMYDFIDIASKYTVARILERDDFSQRLKEGVPVYMHEIIYPLCQAYDSVAIKADIELGGTDQKFNLLVGRELMREFGMEPQVVLTMPILEGTDGARKMSKSYGNHIGIMEPAKDIFGKVMSLPDTLIVKYLELATDIFPHKLDEYAAALRNSTANPRDIKFELAKTLVRMYHSADQSEKTAQDFEKVFSRGQVPDELPEYHCAAGQLPIVDLLMQSKLMASRAEAKRKIREGAIDIDGQVIKDLSFIVGLEKPVIVKAGKRRFLKVTGKK